MRSIPRTAFALVVPLVLGGMVVVDADEQAAGKKSGDEDSTTVITTITTTKVEKPDEPGKKPEDPKKTKEQDPATKQAAVRKAKASRKAVVKAKMPAVVDPEKVLYVKNRVIFLTSTVDIKMARQIVAQLLYLDAESDEPIQLIINSGGGGVSDGLAIYDTMKAIRAPVHTLVVGRASSMAAVLSAAGEPGFRTAMPHARIMIHEITSGHGRSKITDLRIRMKNSEAVNEILVSCLATDTHKDKAFLRKLMERDHYMTAEEAVGFNLIDRIVTEFGVAPPKDEPDETDKTQNAKPAETPATDAAKSTTEQSQAKPQ